MLDVKECITNYALSDVAKTNIFKDMREEATLYSFDERYKFKDHLTMGENNYMEEHHWQDEDAKKKDGTWKYRTYLPNAYTSAKSVIIGCMDNQIDMGTKGKTELQKLLKEAKSIYAPAKTDLERCESALRSLAKYYPDLTFDDQASIQLQVRGIL